MGSHEREVIHFEWPFSASPIGLPVFGSHSLTWMIEDLLDESNRGKGKIHVHVRRDHL